ncbi:TetR/AcrR family transcriptional regulator [Algiphilus sp.]|uniref:TetR/AcrR family transcriptional regulator n=1 Tax=Algiphilus sp. TaxID=1872431 RepID=UPI002A5EFAF0|nr:TetR/AcrR family transcriptional regulator [Pseudomonadota bacterium]
MPAAVAWAQSTAHRPRITLAAMKTSKRSAEARDSTAAGGKRQYLSHENRRDMLLGVAAEMVERDGWAALTMSALAERAGTSRQLVYHHFANLEALVAQTAWHIFNDVMEGTRASIAAHPDGLQAAVISAESVTLDMPPGRGDALWELMAGTAGGSPELDRIRRNIRSMISNVWMDPVQQRMGLDTESARVFSWIIVMGFWGMRQLVRDGAISRDRGVAVFNDLIRRIEAGSPPPDKT